jgi:hypothetical protein
MIYALGRGDPIAHTVYGYRQAAAASFVGRGGVHIRPRTRKASLEDDATESADASDEVVTYILCRRLPGAV